MKYTVKSVKNFQGREGYGFECSLYKDGKRIGTVTDTASGGMIDFYLDKGEEQIFIEYCKTLPKEQWNEEKSSITKEKWDKLWVGGRAVDPDCFITDLVNKYEQQKQYRKWCKKNTCTVYRTDENKKGQYTVLSIPYNSITKAQLEKKHENKGLVIVNELIKEK